MCKTGHIHAELMAQYAKDAKETRYPWERWECCSPYDDLWRGLSGHPFWEEGVQYRRKQPMIIVNGVEVPAPVKEVPEPGAELYVASVTALNLYRSLKWNGTFGQLGLWEAGILHTTEAAAIQHAKAMLIRKPKEV